jgi:hypothetical protein
MAAAGPARFVRLKLAGPEAPPTVAATVTPPEVVFAVKAVEVAIPFALVLVDVVFVPVSANIPLAPVFGAVNTTIALLTGFCPVSTTVAVNGAANALLMVALCKFPFVAVIVAGPLVVLVRLKVAGLFAPETEAVRV